MKQTAVEWLINQLYENFEMKGDGKVFDELLKQAKEIEKEQIIESYCQGSFDITQDNNIFPRETSEQYYNEKLKNEFGFAFSNNIFQQAKEMEKQQQQQRMYSEEEAYAIWKAGQEYWKTSGESKTFEEFIEQFKKK